MRITVAGLQHAGWPGDVEANLAELDSAAAEAAARGADLLVTPEMFVTGYNLPRAVLLDLAGRDLSGAVAQVARRHGVAILAGLPEPAADGGLLNTVVLLEADGSEVLRYRKTHLFGDLDRQLFVAGDSLGEPVDFRGVSVGLLVCYDVEFPETVRHLAARGADLVLVPTAQMEPFAHVAERVVQTRAWESQVYVAYVNRCGAEGDLRYVGLSSVVGPDGVVLDRLDPQASGLVTAVVDTALVARSRAQNPYLEDRRPELYPDER